MARSTLQRAPARPRKRPASLFVPMVNVVPEGRSGAVAVDHFTMSDEDSSFTRLRATITGRAEEYCPPGRYARLVVGRTLMMTDTLMERNTNLTAALEARGDVLIAGLGLGVVAVPVLKKASVRSVTIVEIDQDVITLVEPSVRRYVGPSAARELRVVLGDINTWRPAQPGRQFDTIYFDIWPTLCGDNLWAMARLRRTFARYLRAGGWVGCWSQALLQARRGR